MPTVHLLVKGKVQGVFFRATARDVALALDLKGWVKNTRDGAVEAVVSGSEDAVQEFVDWCRRGPEGATVASVHTTVARDEAFRDFRILRG